MNSLLRVLPITLLLAGCGGTSVRSSSNLPAPRVVSVLPAPGIEAVWVHDPITIEFSDALDSTTVVDSAVGLKGSNGIPIAKTLALAADGRHLVITPAAVSIQSAEVLVELAPSILGLGGDAIESGAPIRISYAPWNVVGPLPSALAGMGAKATRLDKNGHPVAAWIERVATGQVSDPIHVAHWTGSAWEPFGPTFEVAAQPTGTRSLVLALDASDRPTIAFQDQDLTIHAKRFRDGAWQTLGTGFQGQGDDPLELELALDGAGEPFVAFTEIFGAGGVVKTEVFRFLANAWVIVGVPLNVTTNDSFRPQLVFDAGGPVVAWIELSGATTATYVRKWTGSSWAAVGTPVSGSFNAFGAGPGAGYRLVTSTITSPPSISLMTFDGVVWKPEGAAFAMPATTIQVEASLDSGFPTLAFLDQTGPASAVTRVAQFTATNWSVLLPATPGAGLRISDLTVQPWGAPVVSWEFGADVTRFNR